MTTTLSKLQRDTDWFDLICQELDALRADAVKCADKDSIVPPDKLIAAVKEEVKNIRQLADFPDLPIPLIGFGPDGDVCLTWDFKDGSFDLIFGLERLTARLTVDFKQQVIAKKDVPATLARLAA